MQPHGSCQVFREPSLNALVSSDEVRMGQVEVGKSAIALCRTEALVKIRVRHERLSLQIFDRAVDGLDESPIALPFCLKSRATLPQDSILLDSNGTWDPGGLGWRGVIRIVVSSA